MQLQYRRRRGRHPSLKDRAYLITTFAGLVLCTFSWSYFHHHFLDDLPGQASTQGGSSLGRRGSSKVAASSSAGHPASEAPSFCERHFGMQWVREWNVTQRQVCGSPAQSVQAPKFASSITCRSADPDNHLPQASGPHVLCDAINLQLDPSKLKRARCLKHRPGYLCMSNTYHHYLLGAWSAACDWPDFQLNDFSKDHMQDIFGGLVFGLDALSAAPEPAAVEELPTLIVTREIHEHANVFHTLTDLLNVYITLEMMGWQGAARQVLILDAHPPASLDLLWPLVAAGGGAEAVEHGGNPWDAQLGGRYLVRRVEDLKGTVLFQRAAFVPPGYTSLLFAHLYEEGSCRQPTTLFSGFRDFMLAPFGLDSSPQGGDLVRSGSGATSLLIVRLVSRKPSRARRKMARQLANEEEILEVLQQVAGAANTADGADSGGAVVVEVSRLDLGELSLREQLAVVAGTDVLIAMHGAALAYSLLMRPHAAVVELWPQAEGIWRCYENMSLWGGLLYRRLANADPAKHVDTPSGDKTTMDAEALRALVEELLPAVKGRKAAAGTR